MKLEDAYLAQDPEEQMAQVYTLYCPPAKLTVSVC